MRMQFSVHIMSRPSSSTDGTGGNHFNKVVYHETRFEELQAGFWNVLFRVAVKSCAISPSDPWLPYSRHCSSKPSARSCIFQKANAASSFHNTPNLLERRDLQFVRQHTKQECSDRRVKKSIWKVKMGDIHLTQLHLRNR